MLEVYKTPASPIEQFPFAPLNLELLWQELNMVRRLCRAQRVMLATQSDRLQVLNRGVEESRLALALQMSELTELRARLEETRCRMSQLAAPGQGAGRASPQN
jgi:hypothetical protein